MAVMLADTPMTRTRTDRRTLLALATVLIAPRQAVSGTELVPIAIDSPEGRRLVERLRGGGLVLFFRHADTAGEPCDSTYRIGDRAGQRNLSPRGREQARRIGEVLQRERIPLGQILAGPVFRAADTAIEAFGTGVVTITDSLLADDYAGARLDWVLAEHRRLFAEPVPAGSNRVLVGHRTPAIMVLGATVGGWAFPEGAAIVIQPAEPPRILGILMPAPIAGGGFHHC
jgi:phosphohistidine phosphatase SixA